jgi:hypothetical protein
MLHEIGKLLTGPTGTSISADRGRALEASFQAHAISHRHGNSSSFDKNNKEQEHEI